MSEKLYNLLIPGNSSNGSLRKINPGADFAMVNLHLLEWIR
jgi:hypothetical protein